MKGSTEFQIATVGSSMNKEFFTNMDGLHQAVELMNRDFSNAEGLVLPIVLPKFGIGTTAAQNSLTAYARLSIASAIPCPPPMHMVTSANLPPMRSSSYSALIVKMAPVAPTG
jgi:hypothetical protein